MWWEFMRVEARSCVARVAVAAKWQPAIARCRGMARLFAALCTAMPKLTNLRGVLQHQRSHAADLIAAQCS